MKFLVAILPKKIWEFLAQIEAKLRKAIRGVGKMDHESWRRFNNDARSEECQGVVDGDLVEMFQVNYKYNSDKFRRINILQGRLSFARNYSLPVMALVTSASCGLFL